MDDEPSYLEQLPDSAVERILSGTGSGLFIGGIVGSIFSNWQTLPQHIAARPMAALGATGRMMAQYSLTFGLVGLTFTTTDCVAEHLRGKRDTWNGMMGGAAAGLAFGARLGKPQVGVGAAFAMAGTSAVVDLMGGKLVGNGLFNDHATDPTPVHPIPLNEVMSDSVRNLERQ